jgi:hypothetical protein
VSTGDAVVREAGWLLRSGDGLPALLSTAGGPWDAIQPYFPRTPSKSQTQIYVLRRGFKTARFAQQRRLPTYQFHLSLWWPIGQGTTGPGIAETEQQNLDNAIDLLVTRIEGYVTDKSHGGEFMSVAEAPNGADIAVNIADPAQGIPSGYLTASVAYTADDRDYYA